MKVVALLPMKAHSERVKGKNFRNLNGKPLFVWMLDSLLEISEIELVVINTDARKLLAENGVVDSDRVLVRDRGAELLGDYTSMNLILKNDIEAVSADIYVMTHTTNPLLSSETIRLALRRYGEAENNDSLFSVNRYQTRFYRGDSTPINHDPNNLLRTQDLEPWYEENSCLYVFTKDSFSMTGARIGKSPLMFETPPLESFEIDEPADWSVVEALMK